MKTYTYEEAVRYIEEVPKFTKQNTPGHTKELIRRLGCSKEPYRVIHVAGTNGKGSVCAFLEAMLREAGNKTGLFTSPHLIRINERFQIDREEISDEAFAAAFSTVKLAIDEMMSDALPHPTYFEILFAIGKVIFQDAGIDVLVMETGLGGRMDATNTVEHPDVTVITSISPDHMAYLGDTIPAIAGEKAGIIKEGVPLVYDASSPEAAQVIAERAALLHAPAMPFYPLMAQIVARTDEGIDFVLNNRQFDYLSVLVPFMADYQVNNASLALMALRLFDPEKRIPDRAAAFSISKARWSGRMQQVMPGVVLDGAHNEDGIECFLKTVREVQERRSVSLLFSAMSDKDYEEMIRKLGEQARFDSVVVTRVGGARGADPAILAERFRKYSKARVEAVEDPVAAFERALTLRKEGGLLFCAGSLYLVGVILRAVQE